MEDFPFAEEHIVWYPIEKIIEAGKEDVYNLQTEKKTSYLANNTIVKGGFNGTLS